MLFGLIDHISPANVMTPWLYFMLPNTAFILHFHSLLSEQNSVRIRAKCPYHVYVIKQSNLHKGSNIQNYCLFGFFVCCLGFVYGWACFVCFFLLQLSTPSYLCFLLAAAAVVVELSKGGDTVKHTESRTKPLLRGE